MLGPSLQKLGHLTVVCMELNYQAGGAWQCNVYNLAGGAISPHYYTGGRKGFATLSDADSPHLQPFPAPSEVQFVMVTLKLVRIIQSIMLV